MKHEVVAKPNSLKDLFLTILGWVCWILFFVVFIPYACIWL